ncbi:cell division protein FtsZ [Roseospira marina]|uniref:Cell division protein FtsZ n=1 Tax=Roseospira marina TaxID=140057 RepID=A0A5M6IA71_9PROT|nr:cell division protein FtsZ [Roseospira marina]KAA5604578.1 cell division protein FtsZ [Roseospira marina]MBB4315328.1 cell division protein FtsZ [Roseospira marina]MBB5088327.1 cell division protein FtsZ [Roseospira marina]
MSINLGVPDDIEPQMKPRITVIGVGGAGGNAVNNMIEAHLEGVDFVVANTDAQALAQARTDRRIQLGGETTHGLGSGARPDIGRAAAEESYEAVSAEMKGSHMCFITAGMGGGTGTGAAPVVARCARDMGILTVGVVTKPFQFEGTHRMRLAEGGIDELSQYVDTLIIIPNQNLFRVANEKTTFADAFKMADNVLYAGVRSVTDLMIMPGLINLDFADVRTVMMDMGRAMMGTGESAGENRAIEAAEAAIANPLLEETSMRGARGVLINITGGNDMTLYEVDEAANRIREEIKCEDANVIFGSCLDSSIEGTMRVSVVASGIDAVTQARPQEGLEASGSGFGLGLAAGRAAIGGAERTARPGAPDRESRPAAAASHADVQTHATSVGAASEREPQVLDDTAADLRGRETRAGDDMVDPAAVLDEQGRAKARSSNAAERAPSRSEGASSSTGGHGGHGDVASRPSFPLQPGQGGGGAGAFIPQRAAQPPVASGARLTPPTAGGAPGAGGQAVGSGNGYAYGHAEGVPPVSGQNALDRNAQPRPTLSQPMHPAPQPGRPTLQPGIQPGLRVASEGTPKRDGGGYEVREYHGPRRDARDTREEERRSQRPSLFQRMTGFGRARAEEEEREREREAALERARERARQPRSSEETGEPRAMTVNPEDRPVSSHREDQLEIPAFLRRQAN